MKCTRFCPAKVNLFLEVTGKRPNGYHELATLFAKIDLGDTLTLDVTPANVTRLDLQITGPQRGQISANEHNLVCKAARAFLEHFSLQAHIALHLEKHVPTGAGLGGGSSDAAGVLLSLCEVFDKNPHELLPLAAKLGADVPLFMYPDTFLRGEGIGEKLTPLSTSAVLPHLVLVYPNVAVSTPAVFSRIKLPSSDEILTNVSKLDRLIDVVRNGNPLTDWKPLLFNRLEEGVLPFVPVVSESLTALVQAGGEICSMSGSGSTVFALVGTNKQACEMAAKLQHLKMPVFAVSFYGGQVHADNRNTNLSDE